MEIAQPWFLCLLLLLPLLALPLRRSLAALSRRRHAASLTLRALLLGLLVLALAGVRVRWPSRELAVVYVVDDSASISPAARESARAWIAESMRARGAGDRAGVIGFARLPAVWQPLVVGGNLSVTWPETRDRTATQVAAALELARATLPTNGARRVVLLSDGNDTGGGTAEVARRLATSGAELWTQPLRNAGAPEVLVEKVEVPRRLKLGEPFDLSATIRSNVATAATVKLSQKGFLIDQRELALQPGANAFRAPNLRVEGSFVSYEIEVAAAQDTVVENNRGVATASLRGQPRVLLIDPDERQLRPLAEALRSENITVETRALPGLPRTAEDLQQWDLLLLSDVPALALGREQMELYRHWVQDFAGGFVLLGGENSFGAGGYFRTPVEAMLPVRMEHADRQDTPSVALLIVLDRSGSMSAPVQGQTKMSLANQGAVFAMNALGPRDQFGVLAVDVRAHAVAPFAHVSARQSSEAKIMSVTAGGGGIYIYTSLAEAFQTLRDASARVKHVILFSDAADAEEKVAGEMSDGAQSGGSTLDLASAMFAAKITTSVVALGSDADKDTGFLRQLAERGNGRFYLTSDATSLPQIFSTETMKVAQSSLVEEPFQAVSVATSPLLAGLDWAQSPLLLGYNTTKAKPTADVLLATERGEPLLAVWRYGLGQTAAFASDAKSRWASEWLGWPGFGKFWPQLVRGLMRNAEQTTFSVAAEEHGDRLELTIDALTPAGGFRNQMPVQVRARLPDGTAQSVAAVQVAPGSYRAAVTLPGAGTTVLSIASPDLPEGTYVFGHTRSFPREFLSTGTDEATLRSLAKIGAGRFDAPPAEVFARPPHAATLPRDLTDAFLISALLLLPLDIWLRRRP